MQGRLVPSPEGRLQGFPADHWREEFDIAARMNLMNIEWIYDEENESRNPLVTERIEIIQEAIDSTGVGVPCVCADYFMDRPWIQAGKRDRLELSRKLIRLVEAAASIGAGYVDLPFLDNSSLGEGMWFAEVREFLEPALEVARTNAILVCLETDLDSARVQSLLESLDHPAAAVCYDSGNSASLGHDIEQEFSAYGERIGSVHIKDRVRGGGTVPLGVGDADFDALFEQLERVSYAGPLILQAARGHDYLKAVRRSIRFLNPYLTPEGLKC
jgi:L-ribulose-5-phosphate 3-epimerase